MADFDRFRSFTERYVIERAGSFRTGFEQEDAFAAVLDAKGIYNNIAAQAKYMDRPEQGEITQGAAGQLPPRTGIPPRPPLQQALVPRPVQAQKQAQKQAWADAIRTVLKNYKIMED